MAGWRIEYAMATTTECSDSHEKSQKRKPINANTAARELADCEQESDEIARRNIMCAVLKVKIKIAKLHALHETPWVRKGEIAAAPHTHKKRRFSVSV